MQASANIELTPEELLEEALKYKNFIAKGGVTATGGEPLVQAEFLTEFFRLCKRENLHTALDTSGAIFNEKTKEALQYTDLVLLDIKSIQPEVHKRLTGVKLKNTLQFLDYLEKKQIPTWIRHVIVPDYTDNDEQLTKLAKYLKQYTTIKKIELLPYHTMGIKKYEQLNLNYSLKDTKPLSEERFSQTKELFQRELPDLFK